MKDDNDLLNVKDNYGRRTGLDRRKNSDLPVEEERRTGKERRNGEDRRNGGGNRERDPERRIGEILIDSILSKQ